MDFSMKRTLKILTLTIALLVGSVSVSHAEWTEVLDDLGDTFYVDFKRIRKVDGFVYFWLLSNYSKPLGDGILSSKTYHQGDCKLFRLKDLSFSHHKEPMGGGRGDVNTLKYDWTYPSPNSLNESILKSVCSR